ncbi:MAG: amidohydrolase family protein, partial [Elusimicrobia bacterium]|nr:amidohydrolase family protein [Elusimicrobiota bacterium]
YLGYVHRYAYDDFYAPAYELAEKYAVPVVFHAGDASSDKAKLKYADPLTIDEVAVDHPKVSFVIAHIGYPWWQSAAEVAYKNKNVYLDGSGILAGDLRNISSFDAYRYMVEPLRWAFGYIEAPQRFLYGSDWPLVPMKGYIDIFQRAIPRKYWDDVFYLNAARLFKLENKKSAAP